MASSPDWFRLVCVRSDECGLRGLNEHRWVDCALAAPCATAVLGPSAGSNACAAPDNVVMAAGGAFSDACFFVSDYWKTSVAPSPGERRRTRASEPSAVVQPALRAGHAAVARGRAAGQGEAAVSQHVEHDHALPCLCIVSALPASASVCAPTVAQFNFWALRRGSPPEGGLPRILDFIVCFLDF